MNFMTNVQKLAEEITQANNYELVHVEFLQDGKQWVLRIYLDKEGGITIDDCKKVSRQLSYELDAEDIIPHHYSLEVSSPGVDRVMGKIEDYKKYADNNIVIRLKQPHEGRKKFNGKLLGINNEKTNVIVEIDNDEYNIPFDLIKKANLKIDINF